MANTSAIVGLSCKCILEAFDSRDRDVDPLINSPAPLVLSDVGKETQAKVWDQLSKKLDRIKPGVMEAVV